MLSDLHLPVALCDCEPKSRQGGVGWGWDMRDLLATWLILAREFRVSSSTNHTNTQGDDRAWGPFVLPLIGFIQRQREACMHMLVDVRIQLSPSTMGSEQ